MKIVRAGAEAGAKMLSKIMLEPLNIRSTPRNTDLKGQCHEISDPRGFFSPVTTP
jgi:hypothetical protein